MHEMWKAASISTIVLQMIESSLFLALQHWVYCVEAEKQERSDFQLTQRCMLAENQVAGQICDLEESKRRLHLADNLVEAMIKACSECTVALDASKSSSIQQLSRVYSQQALLLDMSNNVMMKHAREKQDLTTCYEAELCENTQAIDALLQGVESTNGPLVSVMEMTMRIMLTHAREKHDLTTRHDMDLSSKIHTIDTLLQSVAVLSLQFEMAVESINGRLESLSGTFKEMAADKEQQKHVLAETHALVQQLDANRAARLQRCQHAECERQRCDDVITGMRDKHDVEQ